MSSAKIRLYRLATKRQCFCFPVYSCNVVCWEEANFGSWQLRMQLTKLMHACSTLLYSLCSNARETEAVCLTL